MKKLIMCVGAGIFSLVLSAFAETQVGVLPNEYIAASWVESTGSEWINTGYVPSGTDRVEAKFRFASGSGTSGIWSSRLAGGKKTFTAILLSGNRFRFDRNNNSSASGETTSFVRPLVDYEVVADYGTYEVKVNGDTVKTMASGDYMPSSERPLILFATYDDEGGANNLAKMRLYRFRIVDKDGVVKVDLVPCVRISDDTAGLYDLQRQQFCTNNAGSGGFKVKKIVPSDLPAGYLRLSYLESTGEQWIDTGYVPSCTDKIETKVRFAEAGFGSWQSVFCSRVTSSDRVFSLLVGNNSSDPALVYQYKYGSGSNISSEQWPLRSDIDYEVVVDGGSHTTSINGTSDKDLWNTSFIPAVPFVLFAAPQGKDDGEGHYVVDPDPSKITSKAKIRLYAFKVSNASGETQVDLVPCQKAEDGILGFYDRVRNVFVSNSGTGADFTPGEKMWTVEPGLTKTTWNRRTEEPGQIDSGWAFGIEADCNLTDAQIAALPVGRHEVVFTVTGGVLTLSKTVTVNVIDPLVCTLDESGKRANFTFAADTAARDLFVAYGESDGGNETNGWSFVTRVATVPADVDHLDNVALPNGFVGVNRSLRAFLKQAPAQTQALNPYTAQSYEQDGLVLQYDALENAGYGRYDADATVWTDLKGANDLKLVDGDTVASNYVEIGEKEHKVTSALFSKHEKMTLESVVKPLTTLGDGVAFLIVKDIGSLIWQNKNGSILSTRRPKEYGGKYFYQSYATGYSSFGSLVNSGDYLNLSVAFDYAPTEDLLIPVYVNGVRREPDGVTCFSDYTSGGKYPFEINTGSTSSRFRSIRVYSRNLTEEEVRQNLLVDQWRFGGTILEASDVVVRPIRGIIIVVR